MSTNPEIAETTSAQLELALARRELATKQAELDRLLRRTTISSAIGAALGAFSQTPQARVELEKLQGTLRNTAGGAFVAAGSGPVESANQLNSWVDNYLESDKRNLGLDLLALLARSSAGAQGVLGLGAGTALATPFVAAEQGVAKVINTQDFLKFVPLLTLIPGGIGLIKALLKFREVKKAQREVDRLEAAATSHAASLTARKANVDNEVRRTLEAAS